MLATFSQDAALRHARAELVHARHPLIAFAYEETRKVELHRAFLLRVRSDAVAKHTPALPVGPGLYGFSVFLFDLSGIRPRTEILPIFVSLKGGSILVGEQAESLLLALLRDAEDVPALPRVDAASIDGLRKAILHQADRARQDLEGRERTLNEARLDRQTLTLNTMCETRVRAAHGRLNVLTQRRAPEFSIRMATMKVQKAERDRDRAIEDLNRWKDFRVESEEIAVGLLHLGEA